VGKPPIKIIADAEKDLDAVRANLEAALVESEKRRSAELAEQTRIQADAEASEKDEQAKIAELEEKVREAEAAKKKSSEASQQRQALEQRLADAQTSDATPRPTESGGQKKLEVLSAYFQQFTVAKMCADADFRFSRDDIDKLQEGISMIIDHEKIDSKAARVMWDRISAQLNAAKASLREADCNDAAQWFRFSMPNVQLGKADPFPFAK
jgi:ATPase subunit of ABC transporter with duplicated ATPase domains